MKGSKKIAKWILAIYIFLAFFHPFIANEKRWAFNIGGQEFSIGAPIPYSYHSIDKEASFSPPFQKGHLLGTDIIGRDTLAGLLKGTEIAVKIGFISTFFALCIALIVGLIAAYAHRFPVKVSWSSLIVLIISTVLLGYYLWVGLQTSIWYLIIATFIVIMVNVGVSYVSRNFQKSFVLPIDSIYLRIVEAFQAIPGLVLILALIGIFDRFDVNTLILVLAFLMWPSLSRYIRAEAVKVLSQDYILAAQAYGASAFRILYKHVLPKLFTSLSVLLTFSIAAAIIIEATLSFLGIGVPIEQVSWGSMLKEAQGNFSAWWLAVFPGLMLFGLVLSLHMLGEKDE